MDEQDEQRLIASARQWVDEVERAYANGGYAAGDNPQPPLDEMQFLLHRIEQLRAITTLGEDYDGTIWFETADGTHHTYDPERHDLWVEID